MSKTCYVMMPYGGDNPEKRAKFLGVFSSIICVAAKQAGFLEEEIVREDHSGDAGAIAQNIINHIRNADIVVADLTDGNPNVYYELGIAHTFHKSSTVLICDKASKPAFDVQHLSIIEYSTDIAEIVSCTQKITDAMIRRLKQTSSTDSSVHLAIPELPKHLTDWIQRDDDAQQTRITFLERENDQMKKQLERLGVQAGGKTGRRSLRDSLQAGIEALAYSGSTAVEQVTKLAESRSYEELLRYLMQVIDRGRLTNSDASRILEVCEKTDNNVVIECVTETVSELFPNDTTFRTKLAKLYARQPSKREEAIEMINGALGLRKNEDGDYVAVDITKLTHNNLARFFDTYLGVELFDELVKVGRFLLDNGGQQESDMIYRNIFSALTRSHRLEEAEELIPILDSMDSDIAYYLLGQYYTRRGNNIRAFEAYEKAMIVDPLDPDYPRILAAYCLDDKLAHKDGKVQIVTPKEGRRAALAYLFRSAEVAKQINNRNAMQTVVNILGRSYNGLTEYREPVLAFLRGTLDHLPYGETDMEGLEYCQGNQDD